jgi:hypothetical protein
MLVSPVVPIICLSTSASHSSSCKFLLATGVVLWRQDYVREKDSIPIAANSYGVSHNKQVGIGVLNCVLSVRGRYGAKA